jgi:hypothetical protein
MASLSSPGSKVATLDTYPIARSKGFREVCPCKLSVSHWLRLLPCCAGAVVLVERGNCSFVDKYQAVVAAGGSGMILYDDIPGIKEEEYLVGGASSCGQPSRQALVGNTRQCLQLQHHSARDMQHSHHTAGQQLLIAHSTACRIVMQQQAHAVC